MSPIIALLYDVGFVLCAILPLALYLLLCPNRLWLSRWHKKLLVTGTGFTLFVILLLVVAEYLFWGGFEARFDDNTVDYLTYFRAMVRDSRAFSPLYAVLGLLAALSIGLTVILRKSLLALMDVPRPALQQRATSFVVLLLLVEFGSGLVGQHIEQNSVQGTCSQAQTGKRCPPLYQEPVLRSALWAMPIDKRWNLHQMQPTLYRSALPDREALPLLNTLGITTIINFYQRSDAEWLPDQTVQQIHLPLHVDRIDDAEVIAVLQSIRQAQARGAVLIHCKHGQQRTGLIAALYRIIDQGWSKEQALAEMYGGGFGGEERFDDAEYYLRRVDIAKIKSALENGDCSTSPWAWCAVKGRFTL
jgi:protein tyrosine/serine phosphatase